MRAFLWLSLTLCLFISGCGTKGPLYIPEQKYPQPQDTKPQDTTKTQDSK